MFEKFKNLFKKQKTGNESMTEITPSNEVEPSNDMEPLNTVEPVINEASESGSLFACPCCGEPVFAESGKYEICPVCGWEDDPVQRKDPDFAGGANTISLAEARQEWIAYKNIQAIKANK